MKNTLFTLLLSLALFSFANAQNVDSFSVNNTVPDVFAFDTLVNHSTNYTSLEWNITGGDYYTQSGFPYDSIVIVRFNSIGCFDISLIVGRGTMYDTITKKCAVRVYDRVAPMISLYGYDTMRIEVFCQFIDPGFSVADNYCTLNEMELYQQTNLDTSSIGTYFIDYTVVDLDSNYATVRRIVEVTNAQPPSLNSKTVYVEVYNSYFQDYVITHSCCDLAGIEVFYQSNVDTAKLGTYFTNMWLKDCHGNISDTITQTVHVVDRIAPILTWTGLDTFFIKRYKQLPPDFDTALHIWDNYDTVLVFNHQKGTYYTTYLVNKAPGCYTVIFNATDNSGNKSNEITIWVCTTPSSIEEEKLQRNVHIYPNPNNGQFTIENRNQAINSISIFNQMGQVVYFKEINHAQNGSIEIEINQTPGLYFIQTKGEKGMSISKILIE